MIKIVVLVSMCMAVTLPFVENQVLLPSTDGEILTQQAFQELIRDMFKMYNDYTGCYAKTCKKHSDCWGKRRCHQKCDKSGLCVLRKLKGRNNLLSQSSDKHDTRLPESLDGPFYENDFDESK